jgi:hypothetical protein
MRKNEATCKTGLTPILWTICPTVRREITEPREPVLIREPKPPLVRCNPALTSGNLGTHDMIPSPNVKKRIRK